jgi:hypothetical protein
MVDENSKYDRVHTDDMALAAYLKLKGHTPLEVWYDANTYVCHWKFNEFAVEDSADFLEDRARVNPRDYTKYFGYARREMFDAKDQVIDR